MIRFVENQDFNSWLALAKEVEPLFGKMVGCDDFEKGIKECITNLSALCFINNDNVIEGIIAINKDENEIAWLSVKENCRGNGYGNQLLKAAIEHLDNKRPIIVQTFSPTIKAGQSARKLYIKFGFKDYKDGGKNPAGIDTVIMKLDN